MRIIKKLVLRIILTSIVRSIVNLYEYAPFARSRFRVPVLGPKPCAGERAVKGLRMRSKTIIRIRMRITIRIILRVI